MSTKYSKQQRLLDIETLRKQRTEKKRKKDLAIQKKINRASKDLIENIFLYEEYHTSACCKSISEVETKLAECRTKGAKMHFLKRNINTHAKASLPFFISYQIIKGLSFLYRV